MRQKVFTTPTLRRKTIQAKAEAEAVSMRGDPWWRLRMQSQTHLLEQQVFCSVAPHTKSVAAR